MRLPGVLLLALVGCGSDAAPPSVPALAPSVPAPAPVALAPLEPAAPPSPAAFVVYAAARTAVISVATAQVIASAEGLWVLDEQRPEVRVWLQSLPSGLPPCACRESASACAHEQVLSVGDAALCSCLPAPIERDEEEEPDEEEGCSETYIAPASLVGGRLYRLGGFHSECGLENLYDASSDSFDLVRHPFDMERSSRALRSLGCTTDVPAGEPAPPRGFEGGFPCEKRGRGYTLVDPQANDDCDECARLSTEAETWVLERGWLAKIEDNVFHAGGARWAAAMRVDPEHCPTAADPCGSPEGFPELAATTGAYWIATDGSAALTFERGQARLLVRGAMPSASFALAEPIGARFHADAHVLVAAMRDRAPRRGPEAPCAPAAVLADSDRDFVDRRGGRDWGTRCVEHLRAGELSFARAACERGLEIVERPDHRAALLYNLGLIAERGGDRASAAAHFRASNELRPTGAAQSALTRVTAP